jgi:hypothetical protein
MKPAATCRKYRADQQTQASARAEAKGRGVLVIFEYPHNADEIWLFLDNRPGGRQLGRQLAHYEPARQVWTAGGKSGYGSLKEALEVAAQQMSTE